jgi:hypothetical protein
VQFVVDNSKSGAGIANGKDGPTMRRHSDMRVGLAHPQMPP